MDLHRFSDEDDKSSRTTTPERLHYASEKFHNNQLINDRWGETKGGSFSPSPESSQDFNVHSLPLTDQISILDMEIDNQRKTVDEELIRTAYDMVGREALNREGGRRVRKKDVYTELGRLLNDPESCERFTTDQLEQVLNLVLVDHSITDCLLTLSHRNTHKNAENMMRRLSSFKSAPKSLVENISFDPEFYGYENGGCSVFTEDNEIEDEEIDTVDNVLPYAAPPTLTTTTSAPTSLNTAASVGGSDSEMNDSDEGEHSSSDSDCESPTQMKKGLRRFFCMPVKSMKAMKSIKLPTRKAPARKAGLLEED